MRLDALELARRLRAIRLLAVDVDGTLTDGRLWYGPDGETVKAFHVHDGLGLKRLLTHGLEVAVVTARNTSIVTRRMADLGISRCIQAANDKGASMRALQHELGLTPEQCAFVGDDLPDLSAFAASGLGFAVADAQSAVRDAAHWVTRTNGGCGAVREVCELLLVAQGLH